MKMNTYRLIDTHAHLAKIKGLERAIEKAKEAGIEAIVSVGSDYESNNSVLEIAERYPSYVHPAFGLHPWSLDMGPSKIEKNIRFIENNIELATAIGEIGLDYDKRIRRFAERELQTDVFRTLLEIGKKHEKPLIIHSRYAWKDAFDLVKDSGVKEAVFHWYTGTSSVLRGITDQGYFVSATPACEYHEEHRRVVRRVKPERLLLETDSPVEYGVKSKWESEPTDLIKTLEAVADTKNKDKSEIAEVTTKNATKLFDLKI